MDGDAQAYAGTAAIASGKPPNDLLWDNSTLGETDGYPG